MKVTKWVKEAVAVGRDMARLTRRLAVEVRREMGRRARSSRSGRRRATTEQRGGAASGAGNVRDLRRPHPNDRPHRRAAGGRTTSRPSAHGAPRQTADRYESWSKEDLYERARKLDIVGRSRMSREELVKALREAQQR